MHVYSPVAVGDKNREVQKQDDSHCYNKHPQDPSPSAFKHVMTGEPVVTVQATASGRDT